MPCYFCGDRDTFLLITMFVGRKYVAKQKENINPYGSYDKAPYKLSGKDLSGHTGTIFTFNCLSYWLILTMEKEIIFFVQK